MQTPPRFWDNHRRLRTWIVGILIGLLILVIGTYAAFQISPWPGAMLIRYEFEKGGRNTAQKMERHAPAGITEVADQQYRQNDKDAYLDVFYPEHTTTPLPTIVWVHGGGWVSGDKDEVDPYLKLVAAKGYTVVGVNYSIAPEKQYPTPILQVNDALQYLQQHAARLNINTARMALAGDSAGSQIVAQIGTIITNPTYAHDMNIQPALAKETLKTMVLFCGAYDLNLPNYSGADGWFLHTVLWAYSGKKDFLSDPALRHASVINYVTRDFPPTFITAGNVDPLETQSTEFAKKLAGLGVATSALFYPQNYQPALNHEYQFDLDNADGTHAFDQMIAFLQKNL